MHQVNFPCESSYGYFSDGKKDKRYPAVNMYQLQGSSLGYDTNESWPGNGRQVSEQRQREVLRRRYESTLRTFQRLNTVVASK